MEITTCMSLKPSWNLQGPYDIHVCLHGEFENGEKGSQEETGSELGRTSVILTESTPSEPCLLRVECKEGAELASTVILSNARHVEIHDVMDGYMRTVRGERLQDADSEGGGGGGVVYKKEISLERPLKSLRLKFVSLADKGTLHLHDIHATLRRTAAGESAASLAAGRHGNIDMDRVRNLLSTQQPISEKAESLMSTIEQYQKNQSSVMKDLHQSVAGSIGNQKPGAGDVGMMGQMAGLLSSLSRTSLSENMPVGPDAMMKMMSSCGGGEKGDSQMNEGMYGALKAMCSDVTRMRSLEKQDDADDSNKEQPERIADENNTNVKAESAISLQDQLQPFLTGLEERMMQRLEVRLDSLQSHFDNRLSRLETMLTELLSKSATQSTMQSHQSQEIQDEIEDLNNS